MLKLTAKKPFHIFCTLLLSKNVGDFPDTKIKKWFQYHKALFTKGKIIKVENYSDYYREFIAFYIYYLCLNSNSQIAIIESKTYIINAIRELDEYLHSIFGECGLIIDAKHSNSKLDFDNGSKVQRFTPLSYNLKSWDKLNFVYFDESLIKNTEKLYYDLKLLKERQDVSSVILTIKNDLKKDFPEIKIVEIQ